MIKPTIGRMVWFTPSSEEPIYDSISWDNTQPLAAIIAHVNDDGTVNLSVFDMFGAQSHRQSVTLVQPETTTKPKGHFCEWMPYQVGQAAKTEEVSKTLASALQGQSQTTTK